MALLLCFSLTTNQAFAVPVAIPIIVGGVAVVAAVAVMLGYQTTDSDDFHEIYQYISDKTEINKAKVTTAYVLTSVLVNQVQSALNGITGGIKNKVWQFPKKYVTESKTEGQTVALSRFVPILTPNVGTTGKVYSQGYGYNTAESFCTITENNYKVSNALKIGDKYLRFKYDADTCFPQYSLDKTTWYGLKITSDSELLIGKTQEGSRWDSANYSKMKFSINSDFTVDVSTIFYNGYGDYTRLVNYKIYTQSMERITSTTDATAVSHTNADVPVNQLPVDATKVNGKTLDGTKAYTEADVVYNASDVKVTDLTSIDPIVKVPANGGNTGGNTGGTDMSLWDWLKAGIATIIEVLRSIPTSVNNIGTNIVKAVEFVPTAINNIGTNIVTAINVLPQVMQNIGTDIVSKLMAIPTAISTSISTALEGVADIPNNMNNNYKDLFIPDANLIQTKYNKLTLDLGNKLGVIRQSFDLMFKLVAQDFKVKQPSLKITLYEPYGDGSTVELIDWSFFNQYWPTYQNIASAIVWFLFFRKVVINSNEYFGGGK